LEISSPLLDSLVQWLTPLLPFSGLVLAVILGLAVVNKYLNKQVESHKAFQFRKQLIFTGAVMVAIIILLIAIPIDDGLRGQLFGLLGIMVSAIIALSSTTIVGNIMAGLMLRSVGSFNIGDFIKIADHFGRVSEIDILHVEIQTEDRDLKTLPNLYLIHQPFAVIHSTGTIISSEVSLGYDVDRVLLEKLLIEAATDAGLSDPFVQIMALGDFSVNYRVGGMLSEVKHLISSRSRLRGKIMDHLHSNGIEIASPTLMNQRQFPQETAFIPAYSAVTENPDGSKAVVEDLVFDKAERASKIERLRQRLADNVKKLSELESATSDKVKAEDVGNKEQKPGSADKAALYQHQNERLKFWLNELEKSEQN